MCFKEDQIHSWIKNDSTINFLKTWEQIYNLNFKFVNLPRDKRNPTKWVKLTNTIGLIVEKPHNQGTYAHKNIALEFATWLSPESKLFLLQDYQRLKTSELNVKKPNWYLNRGLSKRNYLIQNNKYVITNILFYNSILIY